MKKVDELIEKLAENIIRIINTGDEAAHEVAEKTSALAKLIEAQYERPQRNCAVETRFVGLSKEELHKTAKEQMGKIRKEIQSMT